MLFSQKTLPPTSGLYTYNIPVYSGTRPIYYGAATVPPTQLEGQEFSASIMKPEPGFAGFTVEDCAAMGISFVVPLIIFAAVDMLLSFSLHYQYMALDWIFIVIILGVAGWICYIGVKRMLKKADGLSDHRAIWAAALVIGVVLAFVTAMTLGLKNYYRHTYQYFQWKELNSYKGVNPSTMEGRSFMDAGRISFTAGSHLDLSKSSGFMNLDMYCVAPIVSSGKQPPTYDFWAVGTNCCTSAANSFACGQPLRTDSTTGGLRLLSESELPFYKMAVTQASTKYGVKTSHPIFLHWVQDTNQALAESASKGWSDFGFTFTCFAVFQALVVILSALGVTIVKSKYT